MPEVPEGTQLIHRVECPYGPLVEDIIMKSGRPAGAHTIADVQAFAEL